MTEAMNDQAPAVSDADPRVAGAMLKEARQAAGLSLDVLSATLKVTPVKLQALEAGDLTALPDAQFARALAKTIARQLQIDPAAVLKHLPGAQARPLGPEREPLNQPFKERRHSGTMFDQGGAGLDWATLLSPRWLVPAGMLLVALGIYLLPEHIQRPSWWSISAAPASAAVASAVEVAASPAVAASADPLFPPAEAAQALPAVASEAPGAASTQEVLQPVVGSSSPTSAGLTAAQAVPPAQPPSVLLKASEAAWIEVVDGEGKKVFSRLLKAGETASIDGVPPFKARVGNAAHVEVQHKGQPFDLTPFVRNNVARIELP